MVNLFAPTPICIWAIALTSGFACSSRYQLERTERRAEHECVTAVGTSSTAPSDTQMAPTPETAGDASESSGAANQTEHDCAQHSLSLDASNGYGPEPSTADVISTFDTSLPVSTDAAEDTSSTLPFVVPPRVPTPAAPIRAQVSHAIMVSVDGLASRFLDQVIEAGNAPTFKTLQGMAAWTHNARTDKTHTITLPNHTSMLTGLPVWPAAGFEAFRAHLQTGNVDPLLSETLHTLRLPARDYTPSVFDVVHDHGRRTALFASKTKFSLFSQTYNDAGAADSVGADNGRRKIDTVVINTYAAAMVDELVSAWSSQPANFTFVHFNQPDGAGHSIGWGSPEYLAAVADMDVLLGRILSAILAGPLAQKTALIVTTDHGGVGLGHNDSTDVLNFQIPFYVMAPGIQPGDAYAAFDNRFAPEPTNPEYQSVYQPLRNGDAGNLALYLMGLPPVPESIIHSAGLRVSH